jgi:hypothetical protein
VTPASYGITALLSGDRSQGRVSFRVLAAAAVVMAAGATWLWSDCSEWGSGRKPDRMSRRAPI